MYRVPGNLMTSLRFDDFLIGDVLGVGTVGTIYRVTRRDSGQACALKLLLPSVSSDANIVRRFEREMLILSKLNHPNIVAYFGNGKHEGRLFYVMELIEGGTLKEVLQRCGPLSWPEAAECGRQLASALQHAHNHGVIHRDLKPGNVFFTNEGQTKLGDFGIAKDLRAHDLTDTGLTVGTYAYMAPELVRGSREITGQVDLYALGCLLFEMLTGRTPYVGDNFASIFDQHLTAAAPRPSDQGAVCPPELDQLVVHLLSKSPDDRPFNARAVQGVLGEMLAAEMDMDRRSARNDRAALSVRPVQLRLRDRIHLTHSPRTVSWGALGIISLGLLAFIVAMFFLQERF
jgi:serine/threonine protein kinase